MISCNWFAGSSQDLRIFLSVSLWARIEEMNDARMEIVLLTPGPTEGLLKKVVAIYVTSHPCTHVDSQAATYMKVFPRGWSTELQVYRIAVQRLRVDKSLLLVDRAIKSNIHVL